MRAKLIREFHKGEDPIRSLGLGMSEPEIILDYLLSARGDATIVTKNSPGSRFKWSINRMLPMSPKSWKSLREMLKANNLKLNKKYVEKVYNSDFHEYFTQFNYCYLLSKIYDNGEIWYYDGMDLVQGDRTIVYCYGKDGMTFRELIDEVRKSPRLLGKK